MAQEHLLDRYRGNNNVYMMFGNKADLPDIIKLRKSLNKDPDFFNQADLVVLCILPHSVDTIFKSDPSQEIRGNMMIADSLRELYSVQSGTTRAIIVGKDGGQKARYASLFTAKELSNELFKAISWRPSTQSIEALNAAPDPNGT